MRNLLAFVAAMALTLLGVGWYLDWYQVRSSPAGQGRKSVTVDINTQKIGSDLVKAEQQIQKKLEEKARAAQAEADAREKRSSLAPGTTPSPNVNFTLEP